MKYVDTLIIGAGITGLTYAANCKESYLIVEKEKSPGGLCKTFYKNGFVWDFAGHFFHFANDELKESFEKLIVKDDLVKCVKNTNICFEGNFIDYPFQMNIHQLPKEQFIDCLYDLFHRTEKEPYDSFQDMLYGKFGKSITEYFLKPYNEKLYACDLNELDTNAMGRFFPYADPKQIIDNMKGTKVETYNSTFDYPKMGAQFFVNLLLRKIDTSKLLLESSVETIDVEHKIATINGVEVCYNRLVNTSPLNHFVKLLPDTYANIVEGKLSCNKVLVFNLGFNTSSVNPEVHWTYVPMKDINFYRVGFYNNILGTEPLSMYVEIGYKEDADIDIDKQLQLTLKNLRKLGIITNHQLVAYNSLIINPGYVHITNKSIQCVRKLREALIVNDVYTIGRYGKWTYCSIEDCMMDAINLSKNRDYLL